MYSTWDKAGQDISHPKTLGKLKYRTTGPGPLPNIVYELVEAESLSQNLAPKF